MSISLYKTVRWVGVKNAYSKHVIEHVLTYEKTPFADVSLHVVGMKRIRTLNKRFRGIDAPTDVLSFSAQEGIPVSIDASASDIGDVFVCPLYIKSQAQRFGVAYKEEYTRMLVHGLLHLLGYDHDITKKAKRMFSRQEQLVTKVLS